MVASAGSSVCEIETGTETQHLLFKKFKYPSKGLIKNSRKMEEMSTSSDSSTPAPGDPANRDGRQAAAAAEGGAEPSADRSHTPTPPEAPLPRDSLAYLIRWNKFEEQLCNSFSELFCSEHFVDVTLACEGEFLKAHKIVLAMSSPFFRRIFQETPCKHPVVIIKGMTPKTLRNVLQYIYLGEVVLNKADVNYFMDAADYLSICGVFANLYSCDISAATIQESRGSGDSDDDDSGKLSEPPARTSETEETMPNDGQEQNERQETPGPSSSQSAVIKYHGKTRLTRRYSNTSAPGTSTITSPVEQGQKRSASAEVASSPHSDEVTSESEKTRKSAVQPIQELGSDIELDSAAEDTERHQERIPCPSATKYRKVIQRNPTLHSGGYEDRSVGQTQNWRSSSHGLYSTEYPTGSSSASIPRPYRSTPYSLAGAKDFSSPLQVNVEQNSQPVPSVSSASSNLDMGAARGSKFHSGFTLYTSSHSHPSQRAMYRTQSESDYPPSSSPIALVSTHSRDERLTRHQTESAASLTTSPNYRHSEFPQRSHISLLSTQAWPYQDSHHRSRHSYLEEDSRRHAEGRHRSESVERERSVYGAAKEFLAQTNSRFSGSIPLGTSHTFPQATDLSIPCSQQFAVGLMPQLRSPQASSSAPPTAQTRPKTKAIRSSQVPQSSRYTAAEVDQMVDAVANYPGNIVPCTLCQKFVKRERLRAHIHECHLLSGEKIICPHCGIALKSKGSFRVHIWRHKRGALPLRNTMSDFDRDRPPSPSAGPASH